MGDKAIAHCAYRSRSKINGASLISSAGCVGHSVAQHRSMGSNQGRGAAGCCQCPSRLSWPKRMRNGPATRMTIRRIQITRILVIQKPRMIQHLHLLIHRPMQPQPQPQLQLHPRIARITPLAVVKIGTTLGGINTIVSGIRITAPKLAIPMATTIAKATENRMSMTEKQATKLAAHAAAAQTQPAHQPMHLRLERLIHRPMQPQLQPQLQAQNARITPLAMVKIGTTLVGTSILVSGTHTTAPKQEIRMSMMGKLRTKLAVHAAAAMAIRTHQPKHLMRKRLIHRPLPPQMRRP